MASIVMLNVPKGTEIGIDLNCWNAGPNFIGIKNISNGCHFVYWSPVSSGTLSKSCVRVGKFLIIKDSSNKHFWQWDEQEESFVEICHTEKENIEANWKEMLPRLGPIDETRSKRWNTLTKYISQHIIDKICPDDRFVSSATHFLTNQFISSRQERPNLSMSARSEPPYSCISEAEKCLPKMAEDETTKLCYSKLSKIETNGLSAREITSSHLDQSDRLKKILDENYSTNNLYILGEVQFSFICFLVAQNYDSFEHWKRLLCLICNCDKLLSEMPQLFDIFIMVLHFQLREAPSDFFVDILSANNFLVQTLHVLFTNISSNNQVESNLLQRSKKFQSYLTSKFGWDFLSEPGEWSPTVVH